MCLKYDKICCIKIIKNELVLRTLCITRMDSFLDSKVLFSIQFPQAVTFLAPFPKF